MEIKAYQKIHTQKKKIKIFGKKYKIDNQKLKIYQTITEAITGIGIFISCYILYCLIWTLK